MNKIFYIIALFFLSSCTGFAVYQASFIFLKDNLIPNKKTVISEEYFQSQRYSFALVRIGNNPEITMVLESVKNNEHKWVGNDGLVLVTTPAGRIIRTRGIKNDVNYRMLNQPSQGNSVDYLIDFYDPELYKINGSDVVEENADLVSYKYFIDKNIDVSQTNFVTTIPSINWSEAGTLLSTEDYAVASSQKIHPHFPRIRMNYYYKYTD